MKSGRVNLSSCGLVLIRIEDEGTALYSQLWDGASSMRFDEELKRALGLSDIEASEAWEEYMMTTSFYMLELVDASSNPL